MRAQKKWLNNWRQAIVHLTVGGGEGQKEKNEFI